jgi:hypothetical protein
MLPECQNREMAAENLLSLQLKEPKTETSFCTPPSGKFISCSPQKKPMILEHLEISKSKQCAMDWLFKTFQNNAQCY